MDTKYFQQALKEFGREQRVNRSLGDLKVAEFSYILRRAQELKDAGTEAAQKARRGSCAWCGRRDFSKPCDSPLGHKLYEEVARMGA